MISWFTCSAKDSDRSTSILKIPSRFSENGHWEFLHQNWDKTVWGRNFVAKHHHGSQVVIVHIWYAFAIQLVSLILQLERIKLPPELFLGVGGSSANFWEYSWFNMRIVWDWFILWYCCMIYTLLETFLEKSWQSKSVQWLLVYLLLPFFSFLIIYDRFGFLYTSAFLSYTSSTLSTSMSRF